MSAAIAIEGLSKRFRLYHAKPQTLKERVITIGRTTYEDFWALRDLDLEITQGETIGLLGHNGSGKSTLLKCIGGILQPTTGSIRRTGRLAALLELGAGFHPDLTGRENVYLNGSILGFTKKDVAARFDDIVGFAEMEQFIDMQVKHYSSGMYVRLGFAVAVNVDPDILLVDEVLSVGDESFQRKCLERVAEFQRDGRTIVVVTHAADLVRQICDRAAVLDHGRLVEVAEPGKAVRTFRECLMEGGLGAPQPGDETEDEVPEGGADEAAKGPRVITDGSPMRISAISLEYENSTERAYLLPGERLAVRLDYELIEQAGDLLFPIAIYDDHGRQLFSSTTAVAGLSPLRVESSGTIMFTFARVPLLDGTFFLTLGIASGDGGTVYAWSEQEHTFEVMNPGRVHGVVDIDMTVEVLSAT